METLRWTVLSCLTRTRREIRHKVRNPSKVAVLYHEPQLLGERDET